MIKTQLHRRALRSELKYVKRSVNRQFVGFKDHLKSSLMKCALAWDQFEILAVLRKNCKGDACLLRSQFCRKLKIKILKSDV